VKSNSKDHDSLKLERLIMKHVEVQGKEIVISNIDGKFYAMDDRCGHMNARLSMDNISNDGIVACLSMEQDLMLLQERKQRNLF
jgi:nitrite reductase/ring-hydroxylating ferredoxin subunit